jgi:hypothetical protein
MSLLDIFRSNEEQDEEVEPETKEEQESVDVSEEFERYRVEICYSDGETKIKYGLKYKELEHTVKIYTGEPYVYPEITWGGLKDSRYYYTPEIAMDYDDLLIVSLSNVKDIDITTAEDVVFEATDIELTKVYRRDDEAKEWSLHHQKLTNPDAEYDIKEWLLGEWEARNADN